ncbi:Major Facilitator Superfamily protein [Actinopolyspora mzabensis]|uniref:Multidrug efflux pump Tap n=1 Tax=Actinopolyspora mzabensis TaxID=995066 RepID=A0A1G8ZXG2_ACTMZ|nr:MFS transporter [Actinopolyspora mzabensis]SDK19334.1 Major Facilitator Superfamily protein [Actinopolyspora mzabensis]
MNRSRLLVLWVSTGTVSAASAAGFVAIPWFVLTTTGSAANVGMVTAAELVGMLLATALSGPLIDRVGPARTAPLADLAAALCVGAIPLAEATTGLTLWSLMSLAGAFGAFREPGQTARRVAVPELVTNAGVAMERGAGGMDAALRAGHLSGAPLAGGALALFEPPGVLWLATAVMGLSALLVAYASRGLTTSDSEVSDTSEGFGRRFAAGLGYLRRDRLISWIVVLLLLTNTLDLALTGVLLPTYSARILHDSLALGVLVGALGGAALTGNLLFTWLGARVRRRRMLFTLAFALGPIPPHLAMAAGSGFAVLFVVVATCGLAAGMINPILAAVTYERIPAELRGRVLSLTTLVAQGGTPLGVLFGGLAVEGIGLRTTLTCTALLYLLALAIPVFGGGWREMNRPRTRPTVEDVLAGSTPHGGQELADSSSPGCGRQAENPGC